MATKEQAMKWMEDGKKVFKTSDPEHIHYIEEFTGEIKCLCGNKIETFEDNNEHYEDWEIYTRDITESTVIHRCPECCGILDGNICDICRIKWSFSKRDKQEVSPKSI